MSVFYSENFSSDKYKHDYEFYIYAKKYIQYAINHCYNQAVNNNALSAKLENLLADLTYELDHH